MVELVGTYTIAYIDLGVGFKYFFVFTPIWGFMIQFDLRIFIKWVGEKPPTTYLP